MPAGSYTIVRALGGTPPEPTKLARARDPLIPQFTRASVNEAGALLHEAEPVPHRQSKPYDLVLS